MDYLALRKRRFLVTGASGGIGRSVAIEASRAGAQVTLVGRNRSALDEILALLEGEGHFVAEHDFDDLAGIPDLITTAAHEMGGIDVLVHCAGVHSALPLKAIREQDVASVLNLNVASAVLLAKAYRHRQIPKASASVIFMSSAVGLVGQAGVSLYAASKGAIVTLTKSLALELAREGIRVNCICPGVVDTQMTRNIRTTFGDAAFQAIERAHPLGIGSATDVANAALYLASDASKWVTGTALVVDGGYTAA